MEKFYALSAVLTGFSIFDLQGTGVGLAYFATVNRIIGEPMFMELLNTFKAIEQECGENPEVLEQAIKRSILSDPKLGPVARNIVKMWYLGSWYPMPDTWRSKYGISADDVNFVVSPAAYIEGLVWKAMATHPMGAKQPGYGSWSEPPAPALS